VVEGDFAEDFLIRDVAGVGKLITARLLGGVKGGIRLLDQASAALRVIRGAGDADTEGNGDLDLARIQASGPLVDHANDPFPDC